MSDSEEDYMSAAILEEAERLSQPAPAARKRPRRPPPPAPQPRKKRTPQEQAADERALRARGLKTSLLPPAQDGEGAARRSASPGADPEGRESQEARSGPQGAAWRQMLAMGFRPGGQLGARAGPGQAEPLPIDERRLKGGEHARAGIGAAPTAEGQEQAQETLAPLLREEEEARRAQAADELLRKQGEDYKARQSARLAERHELALLRRARGAVLALDEKDGRGWTPLWEDGPAWLERKQQDARRLPGLAPRAASDGDDGRDKARAQQAAEEARRDEEMAAFATLPVGEQLARTLAHLRGTHFFCLFCREQYGSALEMAETCPGEGEDAHEDADGAECDGA